jgi:hypothetical protein
VVNPLGLLCVSRQTYHETVLKPFAHISLSIGSYLHHETPAVQEFVDALVPAQAKAISRLRVVLSTAYRRPFDLIISALPSRATLGRLEGLSDLEIVLAPFFDIMVEMKAVHLMQGLDCEFVNAPEMQSLQDLRLKSFRLTMEAEFEDGHDNATVSFTQKGEREEL